MSNCVALTARSLSHGSGKRTGGKCTAALVLLNKPRQFLFLQEVSLFFLGVCRGNRELWVQHMRASMGKKVQLCEQVVSECKGGKVSVTFQWIMGLSSKSEPRAAQFSVNREKHERTGSLLHVASRSKGNNCRNPQKKTKMGRELLIFQDPRWCQQLSGFFWILCSVWQRPHSLIGSMSPGTAILLNKKSFILSC